MARAIVWTIVVLAAAAGCTRDPRDELRARGLEPTTESFAASIRDGQTEAVELFLASGLRADARGADGTPLFLLAVARGHAPVVARMLEAGADPQAMGEAGVGPALALAAGRGDREMVETLLEHGAAVDAREGQWGMTPLAVAAFRGHEAVARALLDAGASVDAADHDGATALHRAAMQGHAAVAAALVGAGADVRRATPGGSTALDLASDAGHARVAADLVAAGATASAASAPCAAPSSWSVADPFTDKTPYWPEYAALWTIKSKDGPDSRRVLLRSADAGQSQAFVVRAKAEHWLPRFAPALRELDEYPYGEQRAGRTQTADGVPLDFVIARRQVVRRGRVREDTTHLLGAAWQGERVLVVDAGGATEAFDPEVVLACLRSIRLAQEG